MAEPHHTWLTANLSVTESGCHQLCSVDANVLTIQRTFTQLADRSFSAAGLRVWNSLHCDSLTLILNSSNDL